MTTRRCWCESKSTHPFNDDYVRCSECGTLVLQTGPSDGQLKVQNDDTDFYGKRYWLEHQSEKFKYPSIFERARQDIVERNLHWFQALQKYKLPPAKTLELGCSHGSFVAILRQAGYDASGMEMSPWVVELAKETFDVPMIVGPLEAIDLPACTFDVVALMDVLEHLPDPVATMRRAIELLKPDGILLIQTPEFREEMDYETLVSTNSPFLEQLKADEHLYLFTRNSVTRLFQELGAQHLQFEPPIFYQYDMFLVVSRQPIEFAKLPDANPLETPNGRFVQALLDQYRRIKELEHHVKIIDADREARLEQINTLTEMIQKRKFLR